MRAVLALALASVLAHADVPRDAIERARELEAKLAYDEALAIVESAIAAGQSDRERLVELHLIAGRLAAGLDRAKPAEDHFAIVLALAPETTLPEGTSPKIAVPFTRARTNAVALAVELVIAADHVALDTNLPLVAGIAVRYPDALVATERAALRITRRADAQPVEVRALDRHGNTVWVGTPPAVARTVTTVEEPHVMARWTTWAAASAVALAAGGFAAWRFDSAQNEFDTKRDAGMTDFTELRSIEDRGKRWGLVANISFGISAATAVTSVVFFLRRPREPAVTVTAGPGSIGIVGRF